MRDTYVRTRARVYACPALFLRLQFELKKAVDTRTIGCAAAAVVVVAAVAGSSQLLLPLFPLPSKPATHSSTLSRCLVLFLLSSSAR